jgi:hypothetical protein
MPAPVLPAQKTRVQVFFATKICKDSLRTVVFSRWMWYFYGVCGRRGAQPGWLIILSFES